MAVTRAHSYRRFSLIFSVIYLVCNSNIKLVIILITGHFSAAEEFRVNVKLHGKGRIPQLGSKFHGLWKIVGCNVNIADV